MKKEKSINELDLDAFLHKERDKYIIELDLELDRFRKELSLEKSKYLELIVSKLDIITKILTNYQVSVNPEWLIRNKKIHDSERQNYNEIIKLKSILEKYKELDSIDSIEIIFNNRKDDSIKFESLYGKKTSLENFNDYISKMDFIMSRNQNIESKTSFKEWCFQYTIDIVYQHLFEGGYFKYFKVAFRDKPFTLSNEKAKLLVKLFACIDIHHNYQYYQKYLKKMYNGTMKL